MNSSEKIQIVREIEYIIIFIKISTSCDVPTTILSPNGDTVVLLELCWRCDESTRTYCFHGWGYVVTYTVFGLVFPMPSCKYTGAGCVLDVDFVCDFSLLKMKLRRF